MQGEYNLVDTNGTITTRGKYAHIVGNGTSTSTRSNAHTLDWNGIGWFQGGLQVGGNAQDNGARNVLLEGDAIPTPPIAQPGQTIVVKSVDENGKPTEWECVDAQGVEGGTSIELDTTLTASGKAADAKAVGDELNKKLSKSGGTMSGKIVFPTGDQNAGFANTEDMKIFGYGPVDGAMHMRMGDTTYPFQIRGNGERPKYNDDVIALMSDIPTVPTDDHINDLINTALGVIENGTY